MIRFLAFCDFFPTKQHKVVYQFFCGGRGNSTFNFMSMYGLPSVVNQCTYFPGEGLAFKKVPKFCPLSWIKREVYLAKVLKFSELT